tara:strand:+ start:42 stop:617 length:576 start_codon:yes stop_codon:yes gene_type:complete
MISTRILLDAYSKGYFPMSVAGSIEWFSPEQRGVVPLDGFRIPKRLQRALKKGSFETTVNRVFRDVVVACATRHDPAGNWIDDAILESYVALHEIGYAHSVETWHDNVLVGGLYGVSLHGVFFGESMFYTMPDASKFAFVALVMRLRRQNYRLLDIQWLTPHLAQFGAVEIPRRDYLKSLADAMTHDCRFL